LSAPEGESIVRLTLRTLLAYLDDTLEPMEIKAIGQKVSESEAAQELISRIKQATRRRRITTPPATGPNAFEPNMVADYLDNELSQEQVAELEKICLESDVHLAEVASCHQILALVLGEPAAVPPTAKERMYALVQGREAIPFRKATAAGQGASPTAADHDADEMFLLGLPFYRRGSWLRWALPVAAVLLFAIVGVALWRTVLDVESPQPRTQQQQVAQNPNPADKPNPPPAPVQDQGAGKSNNTGDSSTQKPDNPPVKPVEPKEPDKSNKPSSPELKTGDNAPSGQQTESRPAVSPEEREAAPDTARVKVGKYHLEVPSPRPSLLLQRKDGKDDDWHRIKPSADVYSTDRLVSLPGYASEVRLDCGVHLLLRGHLSEFTPKDQVNMNYLQESFVVLHKPKKGTDADLTLERGRLFISNHRNSGDVVVRLRFENKAWDLTLQPGAEWGIDHIKARVVGQPVALLNCFLLEGKGGIALEDQHFPDLSASGAAYYLWDNRDPRPYFQPRGDKKQLEHEAHLVFAKVPATDSPDTRGMEKALMALQRRMSVETPPLVALDELLTKTEDIYQHALAIYCLASLDNVKGLLDTLATADARHAPDREFALVALRRWLDHGPEQMKKLYDPEKKKGMLRELQYTEDEAQRIIELLNDPTRDQILYDSKFYSNLGRDLLSEKVLIAELAHWRLSSLSHILGVKLEKLQKYNAALPVSDREAAASEVFDLVNKKLLPPDLNKPSGGGGPQPPQGNTRPEPKQQR
jgi:hypothetical protein